MAVPIPYAPTGLKLSISEVGKLACTWSDHASDAHPYSKVQIRIKHSGRDWGGWVDLGKTSESHTFNISYNVNVDAYYYAVQVRAVYEKDGTTRVSAISDLGGGSYKRHWISRPYAPLTPKVTAAQTTRHHITWANHSTEWHPWDSVHIEKSTDGGASWSDVISFDANSKVTSYDYTGFDPLASGASVYYRLSAVHDLTTSQYVYTGYIYGPLLALTDLTVTRVSDNHIKLTWANPNTHTTAVVISRSDNGGAFVDVQTLSGGTTLLSYDDVAGIVAGSTYSYRVRAVAGSTQGTSTDTSSTLASTPTTPTISSVKTLTAASARVDWRAIANAAGYEVTYSTDPTAWDADYTGDDPTAVTVDSGTTLDAIITGLTAGNTYYFHVRAYAYATVGDTGSTQLWSGYSSAASTIVASTPTAPTLTTSVYAVALGTTVRLAWKHNSADGAAQSAWALTTKVNGVETVISSTSENGSQQYHNLDTTGYADGTVIEWWVTTTSVGGTSPVSATGSITVYAAPSVAITTPSADGSFIGTYPLIASWSTSDSISAHPISYRVSITSTESAIVENVDGTQKTIPVGTEVYSKNIDTNATSGSIELHGSDVVLQDNTDYVIAVKVASSSGLQATTKRMFSTEWTGIVLAPTAAVEVDTDALTATITPYVAEGDTDTDYLEVWRIEADDSCTLIASGISSGSPVVDTYPLIGLPDAAYRIIAKTEEGLSAHADVACDQVLKAGLVINYGNQGQMATLRKNIEFDDDFAKDVELKNYAGQRDPVSYFGTAITRTGSWSGSTIKDTDSALVRKLRHVASLLENCVVRAPGGICFTASVQLKFSDSATSAMTTVSISVTRVKA